MLGLKDVGHMLRFKLFVIVNITINGIMPTLDIIIFVI